ncbi:hypothetical protein F5148DRAFT_1243180 [Russula earlei]|uniref:Uncharacterized protein n=1 Tax=Russula earlei TaxID=71964 RepID=A0ACC0TWS4_9AGAM|nr:hypothetical protein F5148DRAFT_1243180 [Russula earlei]
MRTSAVVAFILAMGVAPSFSLPSISARCAHFLKFYYIHLFIFCCRANPALLRRSAQSHGQGQQGQPHGQGPSHGQGQSQWHFSDWPQWPSCQRAASCSPLACRPFH